ncbi:MAG: methyltransferase domain-containing protein [Magnetococcales bacterium]|nr:methyltransferase domain-containing protein [Magnetococcales bacterium]
MTMPECRFCGRPVRVILADLGRSPLSNGFLKPEQLDREEPFFPLCARVCASCFLVQLEEFATPDHIFSDYAYFSSFSDSWLRHMDAYAGRMVQKLGLHGGSQVIEIASNDGYLLQFFQQRGVPVLGVEPAANVARSAIDKGIATWVRFFGTETARMLAGQAFQADLLIGNNVLAHVPDLNDFVAGLKIALKPAGVITMEFPHLQRLVEGNQFDTIYHEHFSYFSLLTVREVFAKHGLVIHDVDELPTHGGSLRIHASHREDASKTVSVAVTELAQRERSLGYDRIETYGAFQKQVERIRDDLVKFLHEARMAGRTVVGYGAPAKGNTLLNYCGVTPESIPFTVDRNPHKQGLYLPGTRIPIRAPEAITEARPDYILILPWNLQEEIIAQLAQVREWGGRFVIAVPELRIL